MFDADKCIKGDIYLASEEFKPYYCEFKGGNDVVLGFRLYDEIKLFYTIGTLYKSAPFSNGEMLSHGRYLMLLKQLDKAV